MLNNNMIKIYKEKRWAAKNIKGERDKRFIRRGLKIQLLLNFQPSSMLRFLALLSISIASLSFLWWK